MGKNLLAYYPVFLSLEACHCLVFGLGRVGVRKLAGLLQSSPASVLAMDILPSNMLSAEARNLINKKNVFFEHRQWRQSDLEQISLAFACSSDKMANLELARECEKRNIFCNCATAPQAGNFIVPATAGEGDVRVAISTGGASPALARRWRLELEDWLSGKSAFAWFMGQLRAFVTTSGDSDNHAKIFAQIAASPMQSWLCDGDYASCRKWLVENVPYLDTEDVDKIFMEIKDAFPR